jgi:hypothetical protein
VFIVAAGAFVVLGGLGLFGSGVEGFLEKWATTPT